MRTLHVRKIDQKNGSEHIELHHIQFPEYHDKGWYRMMISYSAFFESCKPNRNMTDKWLYYLDDDNPVRPPDEYEIERDAKLPVIEHEGLYEFFEHIGYCRKKKRLLK